jgi:DNA-binding Xre family transcriptional regulator
MDEQEQIVAAPPEVIDVVSRDPAISPTDFDIGMAVAKLCSARGITTTELGKRVGISQAQVSRLQNGKQGWRSSTLRRFAAALNVELVVHYR